MSEQPPNQMNTTNRSHEKTANDPLRACNPEGAQAQFSRLAHYNAWMNERLFAAAGRLDEGILNKDIGAYFMSILGTLNHILICDTLWLQRFADHPTRFKVLDGVVALPKPRHLDQIIYADLDYLWLARQRMDQTISAFCTDLRDADLAHQLRFNTMAGEPVRMNFAALLQHLFNHQTHHRGQVSTMLYQHGIDMGVTDMLALIPDTHVSPGQAEIGAVGAPPPTDAAN